MFPEIRVNNGAIIVGYGDTNSPRSHSRTLNLIQVEFYYFDAHVSKKVKKC